MPNEEFARPKRPMMEKRGREDEELQKKKMAEFRSDSLDELLANFEFARIKEYVEKRGREAVQVTVTPVDTVQHCGPCPPDPEPSSSVYVKLENIEGKTGLEMEELESPSAGTGLETPEQQCPPNEGTWETGRTTAAAFLTAGVGSYQGENISSPTECEDTKTFAGTSSTASTPENRRRKTPNEQNKQFDPGGNRKKAPPWNAAITLLSFSGESSEAPCLFSVCASGFVLCVFVFPNCCPFQVVTTQRAERHEGRRGPSR